MRLPRLLVALVSIALSARLASAAPGPAPPPGKSPKVVLVGWDGGDWTLLDRLLSEGKLPNLAGIVAAGRTWDLASFQPMASPMIWTTVATGLSPLDHGVADFQELDPKSRLRLPISGRSRKVPAIWNVASALGKKVGVVGWWATWPAEKVNGFLVSDRSAPVLFDPEVLSRSQALTWPEGLADGVRMLVKREWNPSYEEVARAVPVTRAEFDAAVAAKKDLADPVTGYRKILAATRIHARLVLELYERERPDLTMVYFQGTDEIGHVAGRYLPPLSQGVTAEESRRYAGAVEAIYVESDRVLGELRAKARRDGATLILASDHGFKWGANRPPVASGVQSNIAFLWHQDPGILAAEGPAVVPARERGKASVFDLAPSLARLLGLPGDPRFLGKPIAGFGGAAVPKAPAPRSWSSLTKVERLVVTEPRDDERRAAEEYTKKLIALGYLTGSEAAAVDARPPDRAGTQTAGHYQNLASFLRERGQVAESLPLYRQALEVDPKSATAWMNLSIALFQLERWKESDEALLSALKNGLNDPEGNAYRRVASYSQRIGKKPALKAELTRYLRALVAAYPESDRYRSSLGKALFEAQRCDDSRAVFQEIVARRPRDVEAHNMMGLSSLCLGRQAEAADWLRKSLVLDPNQPAVKSALAQIEKGGPSVR